MADGRNDERYIVDNELDQLFEAASGCHNIGSRDSAEPAGAARIPPDWPDLVRLHRTIRKRKVTTILEFGCGYSTLVMAHALHLNQAEDGSFVTSNLRRTNAYELHSVDDMPDFVKQTREDLLRTPYAAGVTFHVSPVLMTTFNDRIATAYSELPNICPDFIYLDGPSQHSVVGKVAGITTAHPDRLPMACDLLRIEHFLLPGTFILVDGRTANARFLKSNLQRGWEYQHDYEADVHTFELVEPPLGPYNQRQIEYCLGGQWPALLKA